MSKRKVLISTLINPIIVSEKLLEYVILNLYNSIDSTESIDIDLKIKFWQALPLWPSIFGNNIEDCELQLCNTDVLEIFLKKEIKSKYEDILETIDVVFNKVISKLPTDKFNSISYDFVDESFDFSGYTSVNHFDIISRDIYRNLQYDDYIFISSDYELESGSLNEFFDKSNKYQTLPIVVPHHSFNISNDTKNITSMDDVNIKFEHCSLHIVMYRPKLLINYLEYVSKFIKKNEYLDNISKKISTLSDEYEIKDCIFYKQDRNKTLNSKNIRKLQNIGPNWFNYLDIKNNIPYIVESEPAIGFYLFYLCILFSNPNDFSLEVSTYPINNNISIEVPEYFLENQYPKKEWAPGNNNSYFKQDILIRNIFRTWIFDIIGESIKLDNTILDEYELYIRSNGKYISKLKNDDINKINFYNEKVSKNHFEMIVKYVISKYKCSYELIGSI